MKNWRRYSAPKRSVTDESVYLSRRRFVRQAATLSLIPASARALSDCDEAVTPRDLTPNTLSEISGYNNYYEFSTNKKAVRILAQELSTEPWTISVEGEVENPRTYDLPQLIAQLPQQERIYPLRCVEGWSMVIPWRGFPLCDLLRILAPTSHARYVEFVGLKRPAEMIGQRNSNFPWPYLEGLRIDEAAHPLSFVATGLYGADLPKQNGAPLRLVVPWKYGFKSIKAITRIRFVREQPVSSWQRAVPSEYGFYANVNPNVRHPRWNQRLENRIGELRKRRTEPFNGYAQAVAPLYVGMDLSRDF